MLYVLIGLAAVVAGGLIFMFIYTVPIAKRVYRTQLVRTEPEKWGRVCSAPDDAEQSAMWQAGLAWAAEHRDAMREVAVQNEGLDLYGEFYDFGSKRCAVILPGRCESLCYSYFFAPPYQAAGMNVLVIDTRCHGKSGGKYSTIGVAESRDLLVWLRFLIDECGMEAIYLHGICIGSNAGYLAMARKDCPAEVKGFVAEGSYMSFRESFKRHMIVDRRPLFPVLDLVMLEIWRHTRTNVVRQSPRRLVKKLHQRALFLFGEQDTFSIPPKSRRLFNTCASRDKRIVWFAKGRHSHLRLTNTKKYDQAIMEFLADE